jgi:hypothetical protein
LTRRSRKRGGFQLLFMGLVLHGIGCVILDLR